MTGRGAIGVPCREQGRWSSFWECLQRLQRPEDTTLFVRYNNSVAQARNEIATDACGLGCEWVFYLDDDQLFGPDVLLRLLERPEAIVIGLTLQRCTADGYFRPMWSQTPVVKGPTPRWVPVNGIETGPNGLMPLVSGTGGGVLIRRAVFDAVPEPWWQMGQHDPTMFFEDIFFYERAAAWGFPVWGDPTVRFGHYSPDVIWPMQRADGSWSTVLAHGFDGFLEQPWPVPTLA